jgi:hypothetical protein
VQERLAGRLDLDCAAELRGERLERALQRVEIALDGLATPTAGQLAASQRRDPPGLVGGRWALARKASPEGALDPLPRPQVRAPRLGDRDPLRSVGAVVAGDVQEAREERCPQHRVLAGKRVGDPDRPGARIVVTEAQARGEPGVDKAQRHHQVEAQVPDRVLGPPAKALLAGQAAALLDRRKGRR